MTLLWLLCCFTNASRAEWDIATSAGYGVRTSPLVQTDDNTILVNFDIAWYGSRFFFDNGDFGFTLIDNDHATLNVISQFNNERNFFSVTNTDFITVGGQGVVGDSIDEPPIVVDTPTPPAGDPTDSPTTPPEDNETPRQPPVEPTVSTASINIPDRDFALEAGLEYFLELPNGALYASAVSDISHTHNGSKLELHYRWQTLVRRWHISGTLGTSWHSQALNNYYFGVTAEEQNQRFRATKIKSGLNYHGNVVVRYAISPTLYWGVHLGIESLADSIQASPIVDTGTVTTMFTGIKYQF